MLCEKYRCTMSETACLARHKKMTRPGLVGYERDPGCVACGVGKALEKKYKDGGLKMEAEIKTKTCKECGKEFVGPRIEKNFYKSKSAPDGLESKCKDCKRKAALKNRQAKRAKKQLKPVKKNDHPVGLDEMVKKIFEQAGHPSVYEALEKRAHLEFRTPALQIIAMISEACD